MSAVSSATEAVAETRRGARIRRLLVGAVGLGIIVLVAMIGLTLTSLSSYQTATRWVNHTFEAKGLVSEIRGNMSRGESARRAYIITRDSYYLAAFNRSATELPHLEDRFQALTADNPRQQANAATLRTLMSEKSAEQESTLQAVESDSSHLLDPAELVREDQATLRRLRDLLKAMTAEEDRLLTLRSHRETSEAEVLAGVVVAAGVLLALLAAASFLMVRRYAADLDRSQSALRQLNVGLEDEVRRRTADLVRANEEIQRFAYIVSHDLRSPLVNVMGFTSELETAAKPLRLLVERLRTEAPQLLSQPAAEAVELDLPESIGFIRSSTQKMDRLINAILRLSREGRRTLSPEPVDMDALVDGVIASLKSQTEAKGARLERLGELPDLVNDRLAVEQVLSNVVENALKYLKPGRPGVIEVRGRTDGTQRVFEVEDNGRGIDPKDHERVFELFRRAGVQDQAGEGIGLAHVRALVYRLGGSISVHSELDRGATFRICLPPKPPLAQETA